MTTLLLVMVLHGNHPSTPTYHVQFDKHIANIAHDFLRQAAHEGVRGELHHSELPLSFGSLSVATSRTLFVPRGSDYYFFYGLSIAVIARKVNCISIYNGRGII